MPSTFRSLHFIVLPALMLTLGCTSTSTPPEATPSTPTPVSEADGSGTEVATARTALEPVYFETDLAVLRTDARRSLKRYAESILEHPEWGVVRIEGHCDERGSDGYNLDLGRRRAAAVERFLVDQGVPASRLVARTFGSQRPAVAGHDESAWRFNRRSELQADEVLASAVR